MLKESVKTFAPNSEQIVLARKPLEKGLSIAENVLKWGTGGINIDGCRVGLNENDDKRLGGNGSWKTDKTAKNVYEGGYEGKEIQSSSLGRFPANFIMTHHPECVCVGTKKVKPSNGSGKASGTNNKFNNGVFQDENREGKFVEGGYGEETIENWNCHEDCPIKIMDEQSGISKTGDIKPHKEKRTETIYGNDNRFFSSIDYREVNFKGDKGGASRFFYCAKASKKERNKGLEGFEKKTSGSLNFRNPSSSGRSEDAQSIKAMGGLTENRMNFHPTVKPISLMRYLVRLITPPNGIVLDPFNGSGTTGIACKLEGMNYVGMELDAEYCKISQARIDNFTESDLKYEVEEQDDVEEVEKTNEVEKNNNQLGLF